MHAKNPILALIVFFICTSTAFAQNPSRVTIKGTLKDTTGEVIPFATVMVLSPADSSLQSFGTSNDRGEFQMANVRNSRYLFKVSHMSYLPLQKLIEPSAQPTYDLGVVTMKPLSSALLEVVIKAAKAPLRIRGDTVEYDATTFKVPPGSTVEDLLRRLPGIEVDADGNIKTQGKDVKRLYVDGKTFFGNDPKSITKNIGAEAISKVQVFNEKSEQAQLTGVDDGVKEKAMNLQLKDEYKKGSFGKVSVGAGTKERWAARGNYNRFNDKNQLSFIGYGNNINQTGVNWDDYGEFKGNNSFGDRDNGDFGFNTGQKYFYFESENDITNSYDGQGMTKNYGGGANYNFDNKKTKFNASYFYNQTDLDYLQNAERLTFIDSLRSFRKNDTLDYNDFRASHSLGTRFEQEFDSSNRLIMKINVKVNQKNTESFEDQQFTDFQLKPYNRLFMHITPENITTRVTSALIYRHLFKKKGRAWAVSAGYNLNHGNTDQAQLNANFNLQALTPTDSIRQYVQKISRVHEYKASTLYSEPITKKWFAEGFYNFSQLVNDNNNQTHLDDQAGSRIDSLSVFYNQRTNYNRVGASIRYSNNGLNIATGAAWQQIQMIGRQALDDGLPWTGDGINKPYSNITPYFNASYQPSNTTWLELSYSNNISPPAFTDLTPLLNTSNPAYRVLGNASLEPENSHQFSFNFNQWNPSSFSNIGVYVSYTLTENPIVYNQLTVFDSAYGMVTQSKPENMGQGNSVSAWMWSNIPIVKTKLSFDINAGYDLRILPTSINGQIDKINADSYEFYSSLNYTPNTKLILSAGFNGSISDARYEQFSQHDQTILNYSLRPSIKWQFIDKTFLESNLNYKWFRNKNLDYNRELPILNASVRRILGKTNKFEIRLAAFDLLDKNVTLEQTANKNYIETTSTNTLARYFMLSFTYNMKGFETKLQKNRFW